MKSLGRSGLADLIERPCAYAGHFADRLRQAGYEILNEVVINQVLVSFGNESTTQNVIRKIQEDGARWCSGTAWYGRRQSVSTFLRGLRLTPIVEMSLEAMLKIVKECSSVNASA